MNFDNCECSRLWRGRHLSFIWAMSRPLYLVRADTLLSCIEAMMYEAQRIPISAFAPKNLNTFMARIYDNIESKFVQGLQDLITDVGIKRVDFCVGYFNLRGWNLVVNQIDQIPGDFIYEGDQRKFRHCRLLIGMHQPDEELVRRLYSDPQIPDAAYAQQCKLEKKFSVHKSNLYISSYIYSFIL